MSIIIEGNTSRAHALFVAWLDGEIANKTEGFWNAFVAYLEVSLIVQPTKILIQELYLENGLDFNGFMVLSYYDTVNKVIIFFDANGVPVTYSDTVNVNDLITFSADNVISEFQAALEIPLLPSVGGSPTMSIAIYIEVWFGNFFPMFNLRNTSGAVLSKGILDVIYENRQSASYYSYIEPDSNITKFELINIGTSKLTLSVPLLKNYEVPYTIQAGQSVFIPVTKLSDYYIRTVETLGGLKVIRP